LQVVRVKGESRAHTIAAAIAPPQVNIPGKLQKNVVKLAAAMSGGKGSAQKGSAQKGSAQRGVGIKPSVDMAEAAKLLGSAMKAPE
jgi:hypothetical protein